MAVNRIKCAGGLLIILCALPLSGGLALTRDGNANTSSLGAAEITLSVRKRPAILVPGQNKAKGRPSLKPNKPGKPIWISKDIRSTGQTKFSVCLPDAGDSVGVMFDRGKSKLLLKTTSGASLDLLVTIKQANKRKAGKGSFINLNCEKSVAIRLALSDPKKLRRKEGLTGRVRMMVRPE